MVDIGNEVPKSDGENDSEFQEDFNLEDPTATEQAEDAPVQDILEVDFSEFCSAQSTSSTQTFGEAGMLSIVNSPKNGKRITLSYDIQEHLNYPDRVQFAFKDGEMAIAEQLPTNGHQFSVRKSGRKGVIYSAALVNEITEMFKLDFKNRVSLTFHDGYYGKVNDLPAVIIKVGA